MGLIGTLTQAVSGAVVSSSDYNSNINSIQTKFDTYGVLTDVARTITVQHTFNPSSTNPPFILGANALNQLVTGLNVDTVDGLSPVAGITVMVTDPLLEISTVADGYAYIVIPDAYDGLVLSSIVAQLTTAGLTGTLDIQLHNVTAAVDMLSTKLTIDSNETSSATAATPVVIDTANDDVSAGDILRVDIDAVRGSTAAQGLLLSLEFSAP